MAIVIRKAGDAYAANPFLKVSIYGQSGTGKTSWACRAPRPLIAVTERQALASIVALNPEALVVLIETYDDFLALFQALKTAHATTVDEQPALELDGAVVQTLVVDSWTDLQSMMIRRLLGLKDASAVLDFDKTMKSLSLQQWGRIIDASEHVWREQRALRLNTIFISLASTTIDDQSRRLTVPSMKGKQLPFAMGQYFNAQGIAVVSRDAASGASKHAIRWVADSARFQCKPAPNWPPFIVNTHEPGETTLGSLLLFTHAGDGLPVAHVEGDSAEYVEKSAALAASDPDSSMYEPEQTPTPAKKEAEDEGGEKRRRRRRK